MAEMVVCPECARKVPAQTQVNFFGFPKMMCPACQRTGTLPLSTGRLTIYAIVGGLGVMMTIVAALGGGLPIVGVIPALMITAIAMDVSVRKKATQARLRWEAAEKALPKAETKK